MRLRNGLSTAASESPQHSARRPQQRPSRSPVTLSLGTRSRCPGWLRRVLLSRIAPMRDIETRTHAARHPHVAKLRFRDPGAPDRGGSARFGQREAGPSRPQRRRCDRAVAVSSAVEAIVSGTGASGKRPVVVGRRGSGQSSSGTRSRLVWTGQRLGQELLRARQGLSPDPPTGPSLADVRSRLP
jgi:hypothetical protein